MASAATSLLPVTRDSIRKKGCFAKSQCCIRSREARLILLWNFAVLFAYRLFYNIDAVMQNVTQSLAVIALIGVFPFIAVFSPVAGLLTDIRFSRNKAVLYSSYAILVKMSIVVLAVGLFTALAAEYKDFQAHHTLQVVGWLPYCKDEMKKRGGKGLVLCDKYALRIACMYLTTASFQICDFQGRF